MKRYELQTVQKMLFELVGTEYEITGNYKNMSTPVNIRHNLDDGTYHEWDSTSMKEFIHGGCRCKFCRRGKPFSVNEKIIYLHIKKIFKEVEGNYVISKNNCDIFHEKMKIIIMYDGHWWHKNKDKDDKFNQFFLHNKSIAKCIIRFREEGCPKLEVMEGLYIIDVPARTRNKQAFVVNYVSKIEEIIKKEYGLSIKIQCDKKLIEKARKMCCSPKNREKLITLMELFCEKYSRVPRRKNATIDGEIYIANQIDEGLTNNIFTDSELKRIRKCQEIYGKKRKSSEDTLKEYKKLIIKNKILPDEKSDDKKERSIAVSFRRYFNNGAYTVEEMNEISEMKKKYRKNEPFDSPEKALEKFRCFINKYHRNLNRSSEDSDERHLYEELSSYCYNDKFTKSQKEEYFLLKEQNSRGKSIYKEKESPEQVLAKYVQFKKESGRKPTTCSKDINEKRIASKMQDFKKKNRFNSEQLMQIYEIMETDHKGNFKKRI